MSTANASQGVAGFFLLEMFVLEIVLVAAVLLTQSGVVAILLALVFPLIAVYRLFTYVDDLITKRLALARREASAHPE